MNIVHVKNIEGIEDINEVLITHEGDVGADGVASYLMRNYEVPDDLTFDFEVREMKCYGRVIDEVVTALMENEKYDYCAALKRIMGMSKKELLDTYLKWEGIIGYTEIIWSIVS